MENRKEVKGYNKEKEEKKTRRAKPAPCIFNISQHQRKLFPLVFYLPCKNAFLSKGTNISS